MLRAVQIQVIEGQKLLEKANDQHVRTLEAPSQRGAILDRNFEEIAVSIDVDSVYAQPKRVEDVFGAASAIAPVLSLDTALVGEKLDSDRNFVWLKRQIDLDPSKRRHILTHKGIGALKESRRYYPDGPLASNLIGFTGIDSNGLEGVELYFDKYLKGAPQRLNAKRDATGKLIIFEDLDKQTRGMDVVLTIDKTIQYIAEKALASAVEGSGAKGGSAIVMDSESAEILALANMPTIDPNNFRDYSPYQWRNRAVTDSFEPGSTLKVFLLASVLEERLASSNDIFFCENGDYEVADTVFHDSSEHGWLTLEKIIKYSSNIGAAKVGERLGPKLLYTYLSDFGFGKETGIALPGESGGLLAEYGDWSGVTLHTISFGQGISTTTLQLATAMNAIANGGLLIKPRIIKRLQTYGGKYVKEQEAEVLRRVISEKTASIVADILTSVTEDGGTGEMAFIDGGFSIAGKTGTAQKPDTENGGYMYNKYIASFLGFVPAKDPRLTILVVVDEPGYHEKASGAYTGGAVAAPAFREIAEESLSYLGLFPGNVEPKRELEMEVPARTGSVTASADRKGSSSMEVAEKSTSIPDFTGLTMRSALRLALDNSLDVDFVGSGWATEQSPEAGRSRPEDGRVMVVFREPLTH